MLTFLRFELSGWCLWYSFIFSYMIHFQLKGRLLDGVFGYLPLLLLILTTFRSTSFRIPRNSITWTKTGPYKSIVRFKAVSIKNRFKAVIIKNRLCVFLENEKWLKEDGKWWKPSHGPINSSLRKFGSHLYISTLNPLRLASLIFLCLSSFDDEFICNQFHAKKTPRSKTNHI